MANFNAFTGRTSSRVIRELKKAIGNSSIGLSRICISLQYSKRTLQRRLNAEGTTYYELRDMVRFNHCISVLTETNLTMVDISTLLGFTDRSSFTTAFKRWTGITPSAFRRESHEQGREKMSNAGLPLSLTVS